MKLLPTRTLSSRCTIMAARPRFPFVFRRSSKRSKDVHIDGHGSVIKKTNKKVSKKKSPTSTSSSGSSAVTSTSSAIASSPFELSLAKACTNNRKYDSIISELDDSDLTKDTVLTSSALTSSALTSSALDNDNEDDDDDEFVRLLSTSDQSLVLLLDALQEHDDEHEYEYDQDEGERQEKEPAASISRPQQSSSSTRRCRTLTFIDQHPASTSSSSTTYTSLVTHIYTRPRTSLQENQVLFYNENDYIRFRRESEQEDLCAALLSMTTTTTTALSSGFETGSPWVLDSSSSDENSCVSSCTDGRRPTEEEEELDEEDEDADSIWDNAILEDLTPDHFNLSLQMDQRMSSFSSMSNDNRRRPRSQARSNSLHRQAVLQHF